jgi:5-hydroxyisourate hydrolase
MARNREPSISTHVLDHERGQPAEGCSVSLSRWENGRLVELAVGVTDADGRVERLVRGNLRAGTYQLAFDVAGYFERQARQAPFLRRVVIDFQVADTTRHYHVPLLLSPYSCTLYRGS